MENTTPPANVDVPFLRGQSDDTDAFLGEKLNASCEADVATTFSFFGLPNEAFILSRQSSAAQCQRCFPVDATTANLWVFHLGL